MAATSDMDTSPTSVSGTHASGSSPSRSMVSCSGVSGSGGGTSPAATGAPAATGGGTDGRWTARVQVTLKPVVNDPAGLSITQALHQLGFGGVQSVRTGKYFEIELDAPAQAAAEAAADEMCRKLLANPVVERYAVSVTRARGEHAAVG